MSTPGVTSYYSSKSQPNTFKNTILIYGVNTILGTSGRVSARIRQQRRNTILIKFDEENGDYF